MIYMGKTGAQTNKITNYIYMALIRSTIRLWMYGAAAKIHLNKIDSHQQSIEDLCWCNEVITH